MIQRFIYAKRILPSLFSAIEIPLSSFFWDREMVGLRRKEFARTNQNCIVFPRIKVTYIVLQSCDDLLCTRARVSSQEIL